MKVRLPRPRAVLHRVLAIRAGEGRAMLRLCVYFGALSFAAVLVEAAQLSLFLAVFGARMLPWAYVASSALGAALALSCTALNAWLGFVRVVRWSLLAAALCLWAAVGLAWTEAPWAVFVIFPLTRVATGVIANQCWALVSDVLDARQAKRLFPLIGAAGELARVVAGWSVALLLASVAVPHLISLGALLVMALFALFSLVPAAPPPPLSPGRQTVGQFLQDTQRGLRAVSRERLLQVVCGLVALVAMIMTTTEYMYQVALKQAVHGSEIAVFHGRFTAACGLVSLFLQMLVVPRLFPLVGIGPLAISAPAAAALGCLGIGLFPFFWPAVAAFLLTSVAEGSASHPATQLAFAPFPAPKRVPAQTFIHGVVKPLCWLAAALLLVFLPAGTGLRWVAVGTLGLAALGGWLALSLPRAYHKALEAALANRQLSLDDFPPALGQRLDPGQLAALLEALNDRDPRPVLFALELLQRSPSEEVREQIASLVHDAREGVAVAAVRALGVFSGRQDATALLDLLGEAPPAAVAREALHWLRQMRHTSGADVAAAHLNHDVPAVRAEAILYHGQAVDEQPIVATQVFLSSADPASRAAGAYLIGELQGASLTPQLVTLCEDADPTVRLAAVRAAGLIDDGSLRACLLRALADSAVRWQAIRSLSRERDRVVPWIRELLAGGDHGSEVLAQLPLVLEEIGTEPAATVVAEATRHELAEVRENAVDSLLRLRRRGSAPAGARLRDSLRHEATFAARCHVALGLAESRRPHTTALGFLNDELRHRIRQSERRLLRLLSVRHSSAAIAPLRSKLWSADPNLQALALELLEGVVGRKIGAWLVPLLEPARVHEKSELVRSLLPEEELSCQGALQLIRSWEDDWLARCADWVSAGPYAEDEERGADIMLLLERLLFLKQVPLFHGLSGEQLEPVAHMMEEVSLEPDEAVFRQGDQGEGLYLIVTGEVGIHRAGREVARLGKSECFGEMALLDDEPRSADAFATTDTELLRLRKEEFDLLIEQYPSLARNIFPVLTGRLRGLLEERERYLGEG